MGSWGVQVILTKKMLVVTLYKHGIIRLPIVKMLGIHHFILSRYSTFFSGEHKQKKFDRIFSLI